MTNPERVVYRDTAVLVAATAARLLTELADLQATKGSASVVLTGGGTGIALLERLRTSDARDAVDWSRIDFYWGDERFIPSDSDERNEKQARAALLDHVDVDTARIHPMPASDGPFGTDVEAGAADYARVLGENTNIGDEESGPIFDITLLGLGGEGHTASLFPGSPAVREAHSWTIAVTDSPKPPPERISLTLPTIRRSTQVWLLSAGKEKADAVALALAGAQEEQLPAAGARGSRRTLWLLDDAAAAASSRGH